MSIILTVWTDNVDELDEPSPVLTREKTVQFDLDPQGPSENRRLGVKKVMMMVHGVAQEDLAKTRTIIIAMILRAQMHLTKRLNYPHDSMSMGEKDRMTQWQTVWKVFCRPCFDSWFFLVGLLHNNSYPFPYTQQWFSPLKSSLFA